MPDKEHSVWFLDVVSFLNELHAVRDQKAGGIAIYRLGTEDPAIWDAINLPRKIRPDESVKTSARAAQEHRYDYRCRRGRNRERRRNADRRRAQD